MIPEESTEEKRKQFFRNPFVDFDVREFACGTGAAVVNITLTYPIHKIIFRQMLYGIRISSAYHQIRNEGILFLYRGMLPPLAQKAVSGAVMFGVYEGSRKPLVEALNFDPHMAKCVAGVIAGSVESVLMPFERVQTLLADSAYHNKFNNTAQSFRYIWVNYGFKELYRGLVPIMLRNGPSNAMFFLMRDEMQTRLPKRENPLYQSMQEFATGALIGAIISSVFYPTNVIKVHMQSSCGGPYISAVSSLVHIYHERGSKLRNIYKGVGINATRAFFSWGIINTAYEQIKKLVY